MSPFHSFTQVEAALALSVFFATFVYEDGATLLAATLTAAGRIDMRLGLASAILGIWVGDMALYAVGASCGRRVTALPWLTRVLSSERMAKAEGWFSEKGSSALVLSRFVPGSRLPLYLAAGTLKFPGSQFAVITGICSALWVSLIFAALHFAPSAWSAPGSSSMWRLSAVILAVPWFLIKIGGPFLRRIRFLVRKYRRWEFWPAWLFYPPVAAMCAWLGLRYRGFALPTVANPAFRNGGIVGESKIEILQALMSVAPELTADAYLVPSGNAATRARLLHQICELNSIPYPFVLKPNVAQRGEGFKLVSSPAEAEQYLEQVSSDVVLQRYVSDQKEAGVFYYRFPGQARGDIFAVTEKIFPTVTGDGARTLEELVNDEERASLIASTYLNRFPQLRGRVLSAGEKLRLVEAGNHCQGCIFRDGSHLASEALRDRIDRISRSIPGFFVGRYDIRYADDAALRRGEAFRIIELNGAASEATNIYDARNSLRSAYSTLYQQWNLVYAIGRANCDLGHRPASARDVLKDWTLYRTISAAYPAAD
jgi:membrane protein DedA with SNARE-associated domain